MLKILILLFINITAFSQTIKELEILEKYLSDNSSYVDISDTKSSNNILNQLIQNKRLFVLGEGGSHSLQMYIPLKIFLLSQLSKKNLHFFFIEGGRGTANMYNDYLQINQNFADNLSHKYTSLKLQIDGMRILYQSGNHFEFKGIDMERSKSFHYSFNNIDIKDADKDAIPLLSSILRDTSYLHYKEKDFYTHQKNFLKYYQIWQTKFVQDSLSIKKILPEMHYKKIKYLLTNKQLLPPSGNRNIGMAENLLAEILSVESNSIAILSVGTAHSIPNNKRSLVSILNKNEIIKGRITVMNVFCYECTINGERLNDLSLKFMSNDKILNVFKKVAQNDFTLFNLSNLPVEFSYIKDYGDLILFSKYQQ